LDNLLPPRSKVRTVKHHDALPYAHVPAFMAELRNREGAAARALEFAILTAARSGEVLGARWAEFDFGTGVWTVAATRMKAGREHRLALPPHALKIVKDMARQNGEFVFCNQSDRPLSEKALYKALRRMGVKDATPHGFRSSFRDWAAERTNYPNHVVEMALAHTIGDKVEAAYRRGDLLDKRRRLMDEWARFCDAPLQPATLSRFGADMASKKASKAKKSGEIITEISTDALNRLAKDYGIEPDDYFNLALRLAIDYVPGFPRFKLQHGSWGKVMRDKGGRPTEWTPERFDELVTDVDGIKKKHGFTTDDEALRHLTQAGKWSRPSRQDDLNKWIKRLKNELGRARSVRQIEDGLEKLVEKIRSSPEN
jgi:hypothetical protein